MANEETEEEKEGKKVKNTWQYIIWTSGRTFSPATQATDN